MIKQTLLDMTQNILSSLNSDEVNSISDTTESMQVAQIIKNKYYDIVSRGSLPELSELFQLRPSLDDQSPVLMYIPAGVTKLEWLKYLNTNAVSDQEGSTTIHDLNVDLQPTNSWSTTSTSTNSIGLGSKTFTVIAGLPAYVNEPISITSGVNTMTGTVTSYIGTQLIVNVTAFTGSGTFSTWAISGTVSQNTIPGYQYVTMLPIQQFIDMVNSFNPSERNVESFQFNDNTNNFTFYYKNDRQPMYCTVISNYYVIFDSFDATQDSTLQASKSMAWGEVMTEFRMEDDFIPDLDDGQFPLLLNEAKSLAFYELKQQIHPLVTQEIKRQWSQVQKNKSVSNRPTYFNELANFGRRNGRYYGTRGFNQPTTNGYET